MADTDGLPDVDLSSVEADLKANAADKGSEDDKGEKDAADLGQFKDPQALLDGYKNVQAFSTKVSQENKGLQAKVAELEENQRIAAQNVPQPAQGGNFSDKFYEDPEGTIDERIAQGVANARIMEVLEEEDNSNHAEFNTRYQWAMHAKQQNPQLGGSAAGVKKLFKEGDKLRKAEMKKGASVALEHIFGEALSEEDIARLKTMVKGDSKPNNNLNAYMPDVDSSTKSGSDLDQKPNVDTQIAEAERSGDADGVLTGLFNKALAE